MAVHIDPGTNIQSVINQNSGGTAYCLRPGVHRLQSIQPKAGDLFVGEYGAILSGARALTQWVQDGARWYTTGQTQQGAIESGAENLASYPMAKYPEDLWFDNVLKLRVSSLASVTAGRWFLDTAADRIYVGDNPAGKVVETSVTAQAFAPSANGVTVKNLYIEKYANAAQLGAVQCGSSWTVQYCAIRRNHGLGLETGSSGLYERNQIRENYQLGIGGGGSNVEVRYNDIAYNGQQFEFGWEAGGSKFAFMTGLNCHHNFCHHNYGPGLWTDINNHDTLYEFNTVEDNTSTGIFHEISYEAIIRNNVCRRNGTSKRYPFWVEQAGISVVASRGVQVYSNLLEDNWNGITALHAARGTGDDGAWELRDLDCHHNTVKSININQAGWGRSGIEDTTGDGAFSAMNNFFANNTYHLGTAANYFMWLHQERNEAYWVAGPEPTATVIR